MKTDASSWRGLPARANAASADASSWRGLPARANAASAGISDAPARASSRAFARAGSPRHRAGFTAIELLVVLVVILILIGMAVPALVGAMRKGSVNDAANAIIRVSSQARQFARTRMLDTSLNYYGLVVVCPSDGKGVFAALTYGKNCPPSENDIATNPPFSYTTGGKPISKLRFNRNVVVYTGADINTPVALAQGSAIGWLYQFRTGYPINQASPTATPVNIGVDQNVAPPGVTVDPKAFVTSPVNLSQLSLRTADNKYRTAVAIYQIGLSNVQDF